MQSHEQTSPSSAPTKGSIARYVVPLILLAAIIGGIAWVVQYLPSRQKATPVARPDDNKPLLAFTHRVAQWGYKDNNPFKEFEQGATGHYDFLFKNALGQDIELVHFASTCDCTSVLVTALPIEEWNRLEAVQKTEPAKELPYPTEPKWEELPKDPLKPIHVRVKANEGGVVRVQWVAKKAPGQELRLNPTVFAQPVGDPGGRKDFAVAVPAVMTHPVRIHPMRASVGTLNSGAVARAEFDAWSSTRDIAKLQLMPQAPDPLFEVTMKPLSPEECASLEKHLLSINTAKIPTRVKSAYHVTVTVYEAKNGHQLDLGMFLRKFYFSLDGFLMPDLPGPEIIGRVQGEIVIGGADDIGKIRFPSFDAAAGATKTVDLQTDEKTVLKTSAHEPSWLKVKLTPEKKARDGKRIWHLEVSMPPKTPGARSFDEPDAVVLQIEGAKERFVRIPIEGHVIGR